MNMNINIGIPDHDRATIAKGLSKLLADSYTLYLKTHNYHWNVTGPMFNTLHTMFMEQYTELWNAVDPPQALEMVRILVEGHEAVARTARGVFPLADKASDEPTADLLTQRLAVHEQAAWMLRSLLEE